MPSADEKVHVIILAAEAANGDALPTMRDKALCSADSFQGGQHVEAAAGLPPV
ncbi:MAG: hypothetical protein NZ602_03470 [Thermoguttaceae bacterium]|nr:hypothetical protein [Thermoguttaceae bacterium]